MLTNTDQLCSHTAFGAMIPVPKCADVMVAGSSCVDYSGLNQHQKEFGEEGESYDTLMATVKYAEKHTPQMVILENVLNFPWEEVEGLWHAQGYATKVALLDSKNFYLPQTRQRGYMIGLRREVNGHPKLELDADAAVLEWFKIMEKLQRRASSPFTDFILADDSEELAKYNQQAGAQISVTKNVPWAKTRVECTSCRSTNFLGFKKPLTEWENNGSCLVPDNCNIPWFKKQVERIWDTIEINHLRAIVHRQYDMAYKW
jgi:site-specific DNA-cytosine methylase